MIYYQEQIIRREIKRIESEIEYSSFPGSSFFSLVLWIFSPEHTIPSPFGRVEFESPANLLVFPKQAHCTILACCFPRNDLGPGRRGLPLLLRSRSFYPCLCVPLPLLLLSILQPLVYFFFEECRWVWQFI